VPRLTQEGRGLRYTSAEVKERKRRVYSREAGSSDRALWPLPGRSAEEQEEAGLRDAAAYADVPGGTWSAGLWLEHAKLMLDSPLWVQHRQCWSVREEFFLEWAAERRMEHVRAGTAPLDASLTQAERRVRRRLREEAAWVGQVVGRHIASFLA
jgi:hypothetical protein